jgi:hypothetical protein
MLVLPTRLSLDKKRAGGTWIHETPTGQFLEFDGKDGWSSMVVVSKCQ